jgi:hypothetical protein
MTQSLEPSNERDHQPKEAGDAEHVDDVKHDEPSLVSHFELAATHQRRAATTDQIASSRPKGQAP